MHDLQVSTSTVWGSFKGLPIMVCRETARKLRQKKLETVQQMHQDVIDLTKENRSLVEELKASISVVRFAVHFLDLASIAAHTLPDPDTRYTATQETSNQRCQEC